MPEDFDAEADLSTSLGNINSDFAKVDKETMSAKLKVRLSQMGFFPNIKEPRVIWVALEPEEEIIFLQQKLDSQLLNLFPNEQKFQAHLTLGRIKSIRRKEDFFNSIKSIHIESKEFEITSFQLMKSELTKLGPIYETLENMPLS